MLDSIPFNIWDDYPDDGTGKSQHTHGYIEEYDELSDEEKEEIAQLVLSYVQTLEGVTASDGGEDVIFDNLTHKRRERLVEELENSGLKYKGIPIDFYSES